MAWKYNKRPRERRGYPTLAVVMRDTGEAGG